MTTAPSDLLATYVATWQRACHDLVALTRDLSQEEGDLPTDLAGWSVKDNIAHTAHLEAVLAGTPEETIEVPPAPHVTGPMNHYCEQGVLARRDRSLAELADEIEAAAATRSAALAADPPTDPGAPAPKSPGDAGWDNATLLRNRPFDVWIHEQDVRRATGRPGGWDSPAAAHTLTVLAASLPFVVGKRVAPPAGTTLRLLVPEADLEAGVRVGDDRRATLVGSDVPADVTVTLRAEDFLVLAAGRRGPERTEPVVEGDQELGRRLLASLAITP